MTKSDIQEYEKDILLTYDEGKEEKYDKINLEDTYYDLEPHESLSRSDSNQSDKSGVNLIMDNLLEDDKNWSFSEDDLFALDVEIDKVEILNFVEDTETEMSKDIDQLKNELDSLLEFDDGLEDLPRYVMQDVATEKVENFFQTMSKSLKKVKIGKILKGPETMAHESSEPASDTKSEETNIAENLLNVTESISEKLSSTIDIGSEVNIVLPDVAMTVRKKELNQNSTSHWQHKEIEVNLPDQASIAGQDDTITVSFSSYENLGSMMTLDQNFSSSVLSIKIIGLDNQEGSIKLVKPLIFKLKHKPRGPSQRPQCVYWDFTTSGWSRDGCSAVEDQSGVNSTTCQCHHLTNFAILIDMHGVAMHEVHKPFLEILTNFGCFFSIVGLILCIIIYSTFRHARNERSSINMNLCICLLLAEVIFIFGIGQTDSMSFCTIVAAGLHYFFLASFFWMLVAGYQIYILLVEVFDHDGSRFIFYYLLGYIAPLLIVLISLLLDTLLNDVSVYGSQYYCWIEPGLHLGFTFLCPLGLIMTANIYFLAVAFRKFSIHSRDMHQQKRSRAASLKSYINGLFGLLFLLGVSWTVGLVSLMYPSIVLSYIFTILNSLQGFFIFFFNCVANKKIRTEGTRKIQDTFSCLFTIRLRPVYRQGSNVSSDTHTTVVKEYFLPDNQYFVNYTEEDKGYNNYRRLNPAEVARDVTYYY